MMLMSNDHDLDERYQCNYDHNITYERVLYAYDDLKTVDHGLVDQPRGLSFGLTLSTYEKDRLLHLFILYFDICA